MAVDLEFIDSNKQAEVIIYQLCPLGTGIVSTDGFHTKFRSQMHNRQCPRQVAHLHASANAPKSLDSIKGAAAQQGRRKTRQAGRDIETLAIHHALITYELLWISGKAQ